MAPFLPWTGSTPGAVFFYNMTTSLFTRSEASFNTTIASSHLSRQFRNPTDTLSVLLILGGDVVQKALAQLAGTTTATTKTTGTHRKFPFLPSFTPVPFSFGWVAYAVGAVVSAVGENRLMPPAPDCRCIVINGQNGFVRENLSWVVGRVVRDYEYWCDGAVETGVRDLVAGVNEGRRRRWAERRKGASGVTEEDGGEAAEEEPEKVTQAGLVVGVYDTGMAGRAGQVKEGLLFFSGVAAMVLQLGIAAIPLGLHGDWAIIMYTAVGSLLCLATGALPQWRKEKWSCRITDKDNRTATILTRGNGAQHAIVVRNRGPSLHLEDLASGARPSDAKMDKTTRLCIIGFAVSWIVLLISVAGQATSTWYLLAVGGVGIVDNIFIAGCPRRPEAYGLHLTYKEVIAKTKVMDALYEVEEKVPGAGRAMLRTFFPGDLDEVEEKKWEDLKKTRKSREDTIETAERKRQGANVSSASSTSQAMQTQAISLVAGN